MSWWTCGTSGNGGCARDPTRFWGKEGLFWKYLSQQASNIRISKLLSVIEKTYCTSKDWYMDASKGNVHGYQIFTNIS